MNKTPTIYTFDAFQKFTDGQISVTLRDNVWVPARPLGYPSVGKRIKAAWMVFTGRADAVVWPAGQ